MIGRMDGKWLKTQFRLNPEKKKKDLSKATGLKPPAISKILAGTRQIKASEYIAMRKFFNLPVEFEKRRTGKGDAGQYVISPLKGVSEKGGAPQDSQDAWVMPASLIKTRTNSPPEKIRIFPVQESSMAPDFNPGEQVLVDLSDTKPSPPGTFLISDGIGQILRRCEFVPFSEPPSVLLSDARNARPHKIPLRKVQIVGRVIAKLEWI